MRRPINTVNGTYKDPNLAFSAQDALNVIPMMTEKSGTRTVSQYRQAPGLKPFCRIGTNDGETVTNAGAGRGLRVVDGKLYAVAGRNLWQITSAGVSVNYGTIPGVGRVSMAHNQRGLGNELAIDNGQSRYVFNTQTQDLQKVTDESFPGSIKAVFIDGYIVFVEPQGRYWGHSDLSNALNYNIFDQYEAEGQPDRIVSAHESNRELLIFGQDTTEAYVNNPSGSGEAPFVRATNTVIKSGCAARDSVCDVGPYTVYLDQNRTVQVLNGYTPVPISTSVIDSVLQACTKQQIANAYAFAVESEGFQIYYLTVPGKFTFGYDFNNREWHRRSSTWLDWWAVTDVVQWNGSWYALDSRRGDILELRWYDYPFDVQEELVREWVTGTISADQNPIFVNELEVLFGCGGQTYTTVDFPEQPAGPGISGAAPDGTVGEAYTYTYTVTEGDAPIQRVKLMEGTLLDGLTWNQYTYTISGTPTEAGTMSLRFRVFDTAGLFADVEDTISVRQPMMATRETGGGTTGYLARILGDWVVSWATNSDITGRTGTQLSDDGRILSYATGGSVYRTDSYGLTSALSTGDGMGGSGGVRLGWIHGDVVGFPGGTNELRRSMDRGENVAIVPGSPDLSALGRNALTGRWIGLSPAGALYYSEDDLATWTEGATLSDATVSVYLSRWCLSDGRVVFGCGNGAGTAPKLFYTDDGETVSSYTLPTFALSSHYITACYEWDGTLIVATEKGEIAYEDADGWHLSAGSMSCFVNQISDNGAEAVFIGGDGSIDANGFIKSSADLENFTTRATAALGGTERWVGITT